jgi:hypothetical protein
MAKGAVVAAVIVGGVVILGIAGFAAASTKPVILPDLGPPPPPPPPDSLGRYLVQEGGKALDELGHSDIVKTYTGGEKAGPYIVKNLATGGLYGTGKGAVNVAKKIYSWF